jgi:FkbM family methyltransferase
MARVEEVSAATTKIRALCRRANLGDTRCDRDGIWFVDDQRIEWLYDTERGVCAMGLERGREHEPEVMKLLQRLLRPGSVLIDAGANVGYFSLKLARAIHGLRVYAFEPVSATYSLLARNIARNGLSDNIVSYQVALGERADVVRITNSLTTGNHLVDRKHKAGRTVEDAQMESLDSMVERIPVRHVDVIKCDIEGAEMQFLRGAENTLRRDRPQLIIEVERRWLARMAASPETVFAFLTKLGYRCTPVSPCGEARGPIGRRPSELSAPSNFHCVWEGRP